MQIKELFQKATDSFNKVFHKCDKHWAYSPKLNDNSGIDQYRSCVKCSRQQMNLYMKYGDQRYKWVNTPMQALDDEKARKGEGCSCKS